MEELVGGGGVVWVVDGGWWMGEVKCGLWGWLMYGVLYQPSVHSTSSIRISAYHMLCTHDILRQLLRILCKLRTLYTLHTLSTFRAFHQLPAHYALNIDIGSS